MTTRCSRIGPSKAKLGAGYGPAGSGEKHYEPRETPESPPKKHCPLCADQPWARVTTRFDKYRNKLVSIADERGYCRCCKEPFEEEPPVRAVAKMGSSAGAAVEAAGKFGYTEELKSPHTNPVLAHKRRPLRQCAGTNLDGEVTSCTFMVRAGRKRCPTCSDRQQEFWHNKHHADARREARAAGGGT